MHPARRDLAALVGGPRGGDVDLAALALHHLNGQGQAAIRTERLALDNARAAEHRQRGEVAACCGQLGGIETLALVQQQAAADVIGVEPFQPGQADGADIHLGPRLDREGHIDGLRGRIQHGIGRADRGQGVALGAQRVAQLGAGGQDGLGARRHAGGEREILADAGRHVALQGDTAQREDRAGAQPHLHLGAGTLRQGVEPVDEVERADRQAGDADIHLAAVVAQAVHRGGKTIDIGMGAGHQRRRSDRRGFA